MRGAAKKVYNNGRKHQIDHSYGSRAQSPVQINPQNARHPELPNPEDGSGKTHEKGKHRHKIPILPNIYSVPLPVPIPPQNAELFPGVPGIYSGVPFPLPIPPYNAGTSYGDFGAYGPYGENYGKGTVSTNLQLPSYRSGMTRGSSTGPGLYGNGQVQFPSGDFSRNPGIYNARGGTRSRDEGLQSGLYGERQGMTQKVSKLQDEDEEGESEIISGKFSPCGGECAKGKI